MSNTAEQFANIWSAKLAKLKLMMARLSRDVGNEALRFLLAQFEKEQTPDGRSWAPRRDGDSSRRLLVKSGRLRRSIRLTNVTRKSVRIGSNVQYAKYHQEGTNKIPERRFIGNSPMLQRRLQRIIKAKILLAMR